MKYHDHTPPFRQGYGPEASSPRKDEIPEGMALGTAFGPVAEKPEGTRPRKDEPMLITSAQLKLFRKAMARTMDELLDKWHSGQPIAPEAKVEPEGERLGTCDHDKQPHQRECGHFIPIQHACLNWQPIAPEAAPKLQQILHDAAETVKQWPSWMKDQEPVAPEAAPNVFGSGMSGYVRAKPPEAAGGEKGKLQCEHGTFLDDHGCEKCDAGFCETKAAPAAPSGEQTREEIEDELQKEFGFRFNGNILAWHDLQKAMAEKFDRDTPRVSSQLWKALIQSRLSLSTLRRERDQQMFDLARVSGEFRQRAETAEAQLRELTEHLAEERAFRITSEKKCVELRSTIETLQQDLRVIRDIERAGFKRQNELQQNVERLKGVVDQYQSLDDGGHLATTTLAELRSGR